MTGESQRNGRRRWRLKLSLRLAMGAVLAIAVGLAWFAHAVREQRRARDLILRHNGLYFYEYEPQTVSRYTRETWVPAWLRRMIGEDWFHDVTWVRIEGPQFGDTELQRLEVLDRIETLGIVQTAITDAGLRHLRGGKALKGLFLVGNWIGDTGIDALDLASRPRLEVLEIRSTQVSEAKIAEIRKRFPRLMILDDGVSHRYIAPGEGHEADRMVKPDDPVLGSRREIPPLRHPKAAGGR
jgi:hypothetical protein